MKLFVVLFCGLSILADLPVHATVTVLNYWHMGEDDPMVQGVNGSATANDSVGTNNLANSAFVINGIFYFYPTYSSAVSVAAASDAGSTLALYYSDDELASGNVIPGLTNNFGIELWVCPVTSSSCFIAYNGNTANNGWGLFQNGMAFSAVFGGGITFGNVPAATNVWTHLALVCNNGTTTLYTNGAVAATTNSLPASPVGNFLLAADSAGRENFSGFMDEVRVFTFSPGQFSTNDLLVNQYSYALGTANLAEGPAAGSDSVALNMVETGAVWTASANATWLHLTIAGGNTSTNLPFSFDANTGTNRTGTLTISGHFFTVTQAGSTYTSAGMATLVSNGLNQPYGAAVDLAGNVYIADTGSNIIKEWHMAGANVTTNVSSGLNNPRALAVDSAGNLYIADTGANAIKEWHVSSGGLSNLVSSGLNAPEGVAVDGAGNVYIADTGNNAIKEWHYATGKLSTNVSSGLNAPQGVAVDGAGNIYIADTGNDAIKEWHAPAGNVTTIVSPGYPSTSLAVDGGGNLYFPNITGRAVEEWHNATGNVTPLASSGLGVPDGVAADPSGNIYLADFSSNVVRELPRAYVDTSPSYEAPLAGEDALPAVVPTSANLTGPFAPASDSAWLTISGITNGAVSFSFTADTSATNRTAHIALLGQLIPITQSTAFNLGAKSIVEGNSAGTESVVLAAGNVTNAWSATANNSWLHLVTGYLSGTGSTNFLFTFDANPGATRTGTLAIGGQTLTITQAGTNYSAAGALTIVPLSTGGVGFSSGVSVDTSGNVYAPDYFRSSCQQWMPGAAQSTGISNTLSGNYIQPASVAVDNTGHLYVLDAPNRALEKWSSNKSTAFILASNTFGLGIGAFGQLAVDAVGNIYFADTTNASVDKWTAANDTFTALVSSGLSQPVGVAVDLAGNLYIADTNYNSIMKWTAASGALGTLVTGLNQPRAVAVDGSGNVFIAETGNGALKKWSAATSGLTTLASGLTGIDGVAVDKNDNLYLSQSTSKSSFSELPRAFVDASVKQLGAQAGTNSLSTILPATESLLLPFVPVNPYQSMSTSNWLFNTNITASGGVVNFSYGANLTGIYRTNYISVLGTLVELVQAPVLAVPPRLTGASLLPNGGGFVFFFTNNPGATFSVLTSTNISLPPAQWTRIGSATNVSLGLYQFTAPATNAHQYYRVSSP